ncbi:MAG: lipase family protein, partial [Planctomycetota bacterium]
MKYLKNALIWLMVAAGLTTQSHAQLAGVSSLYQQINNEIQWAAFAALDDTVGAYKNSDALPANLTRVLFPKSRNPSAVWARKVGTHEITYFVASDDKNLIVAFRGSETYKNWKLNGVPWFKGDKAEGEGKAAKDILALTNGVPAPVPNFSDAVVHYGWANAVNEVYPGIIRAMQQQNYRNKTVTVTGHSLGGALAGYLTFRLVNDKVLNNDRPHRLITFGAPHAAGVMGRGHRDFNLAFMNAIRGNAPNLRAFAIETTNPRDISKPDPVTLSWSWGEGIGDVAESLRSKGQQENSALGTVAEAYTGFANFVRNAAENLNSIWVQPIGTVVQFKVNEKGMDKHDQTLYLTKTLADKGAVPQGWPSFQGIIAYEDDNGWHRPNSDNWLVEIGTYSNKGRGGHAQLTFPNDEVRSLTIPKGVTVYMTDDDSFKKGKHGVLEVTGPGNFNIQAKSRSLAGKVSSMKVG